MYDEEKPFYIQLTYYDSPREDCSGFYSDLFFFDTKEECYKEYKRQLKANEGEPVGIDTNCIAIEEDIKKFILSKEKEMEKVKNDYDTETGHIAADDILCAVLEKLGYTHLVELYNEVGKWYA